MKISLSPCLIIIKVLSVCYKNSNIEIIERKTLLSILNQTKAGMVNGKVTLKD